jgi:two-component system chemotaxis response regulator CheY
MDTMLGGAKVHLSTGGMSVRQCRTCLIVDDSTTIRRVMAAMLQALGYETAEAGTGVEAMTHCCDQVPDLIFLDWNMPNMDGITCLRTLRKMPLTPRPVVILCTTENTLPKIREALESGADEYIMKPFDVDIVRDKLVQLGLAEAENA